MLPVETRAIGLVWALFPVVVLSAMALVWESLLVMSLWALARSAPEQ
jgi:hypothetical protein